MALIKSTLKSGIKALLTEMRTKEENADDYFAEQLSSLIDTYIKSATVTVAAGIGVGDFPLFEAKYRALFAMFEPAWIYLRSVDYRGDVFPMVFPFELS
ncbi:MAG: hypothetical protein ACK5HT_04930 [Draconibacterium sp.]